jgi:transposase
MQTTKLQISFEFKGQKFFIGIDVHKKSWAITVRSLGIQIARFTQRPSVEALVAHLKKNYPGGEYYSAYEAGFCGTGIHEELCKMGVKNIIVHAADIPLSDKQKKSRNDVLDSRAIAEKLEKGEIRGIHILSRQQQELRGLFRLRQSKTEDVTRINNMLKSYLDFFSIQLPSEAAPTDYLSKKALDWLSNLELATEAGTLNLKNRVEELRYQRQQLFIITKQLREQIQNAHAASYKLLLTIPGIGSITAMGLLAEIGDFNRFDDLDQYCSFLGLTPWENSSGENIATKGMQPRCNTHLRPLLTECSWIAIRHDKRLFAYYSKHAIRNNKSAIVKVAAKVALLAKAVVQKQQPYNPDYAPTEKEAQQKTGTKVLRGITEVHTNKKPGKVQLPG